MSTPAPSGTADPLQSTQQQLDELETLIQRMLTLPVNQLDEEAAQDLPSVPPLPESAEHPALDETPLVHSDPAPESAADSMATVASIEIPETSPVHFVSR